MVDWVQVVLDVNFKYNYMSVKNKQTMSLGSQYPSLKKNLISNSRYEILNYTNLYQFIATKLAQKKIFGIFQGKWNMDLEL